MGNTSNYNFPYPDKTSPKTSPADMKALADAIDARIAVNARILGDDWALYVALREAHRVAFPSTVTNWQVSQPFSPLIGGGAAGAMVMTNSRVVLVPQIIPAGEAIDGVSFVQVTPGVYTSTGYNGVGAYTFDGTTFTRIGSSTTSATIWKATTLASFPFTAQIAASSSDRLLWAACLYQSSAEPTIPAIAGMTLGDSGQKFVQPLGMYELGSIAWGSQTTLPATLTSATAGFNMGFTNVPWLSFYRSYA